MGYFFAILGSIAGFCAVFAGAIALANRNDIGLILAAVFWISAMIGWVGAGIIFRMDEYHSKKDTSQ